MKRALGIGLAVLAIAAAVWYLTASHRGEGPATPAPAALSAAPAPGTPERAPAPEAPPAAASPAPIPAPATAATPPAPTRVAGAPTPGEQTGAPAPSAGKPAPARRAALAGGAAAAARGSAPAAPSPAPAAAPAAGSRGTAGAAAASHAATAPLPGAIAGTLRDAQGAPLAGVTILAVGAEGTDAGETVTDDDGFFLFAALHPGRYAVFAGLGTPLAIHLAARGVDVPDAGVRRIELRESAGGATVRVSVLHADGRPAPAQAVLVPGTPRAPSFPELLGSEAIYLPVAESPRQVVPRVPPGLYTVVVLRSDAAPLIASAPVQVRGEGEVAVEVRVPTI
ncbi:MAG TPA: carboxypeptidase-like regulatory domain-containing protein [Anaeromyxobacter sp.]|nr:carboxypeptidase-like regulatory domain-containing protein [Anaeromyxobacter sp.]